MIAKFCDLPVIPSLILEVELRNGSRTAPTREELNQGRVLLNGRLAAIRAQDRQLRGVPTGCVLAMTRSGVWVAHVGDIRLTSVGEATPIDGTGYVRKLYRSTSSLWYGDPSLRLWDAGPKASRFHKQVPIAEFRHHSGPIQFVIRGLGRQRWLVTSPDEECSVFTVLFHATKRCFELQVKQGVVTVENPHNQDTFSLAKWQSLLVDAESGVTEVRTLEVVDSDQDDSSDDSMGDVFQEDFFGMEVDA
jgi:hypothetical protein